VLPEEDGPWFHLAADGSCTRGCRSTSYTSERVRDDGVPGSGGPTPRVTLRTQEDGASPRRQHRPF
jgi:hypothetical protein